MYVRMCHHYAITMLHRMPVCVITPSQRCIVGPHVSLLRHHNTASYARMCHHYAITTLHRMPVCSSLRHHNAASYARMFITLPTAHASCYKKNFDLKFKCLKSNNYHMELTDVKFTYSHLLDKDSVNFAY